MRALAAILTAIAITAVLVVFLLESRTPSPGPLHPVHAREPALDACAACHPRSGGMDEACLACHEEIGARRAAGRGIHGDARPCATCHGEHFGAAAALLSPASFERAGIADLARFDHAGLDLGLVGRHAELACARCHPNAEAEILPAGATRFIGLDAGCASCHEDPHSGSYGNRCAECHAQDAPFAEPRGRAHDRFPLAGAHADLPCARCHDDGGARSVAASLREAPPVRACVDCHVTPHAEGGSAVFLGETASDCARCHDASAFARTFGVAEHRAIGVDLAGAHAALACASCHAPGKPRGDHFEDCTACHADPHARGGSAAAPRFDTAGARPGSARCVDCHSRERFVPATVTAAHHRRFGSPLEGAHRDLACAACHDGRALPLFSTLADCRTCHESPHRAEFEGETPCSECHTSVSFSAVELPPERHRAAGFPLDPPHAEVPCAECHPPAAVTFALRFPGRAADDCAACHGDPHGALLRTGPFAGTGCLDCHERARFLPSTFTLASHGRTSFSLDGAHRAVPCASCHTDRLTFSARGTACADCHESPHRFEARRCEECHGTATFRPATAPFDHARRTRFPLAGAHASLDCAACHGGGRARPPLDCASCHGDPHAGQFREHGPDSCLRCHSAESFTLTAFDHATLARFPLDGEHVNVPCAECHRPQRTSDGRLVVRYRPIPHECSDCHRAGGG